MAVATATVTAQRVSVKTNALYWVAATPNLSAEFRLNRHMTLGLDVAANKFHISSLDSRLVAFSPEVRYWLSARPQVGHFFGLMAGMANYKFTYNEKTYDGDAYGIGPTYGYSFVLGRRWSLELSVGAGLVHYRQRSTESAAEDVSKQPVESKWTLAPLKLGVSFVYVIR